MEYTAKSDQKILHFEIKLGYNENDEVAIENDIDKLVDENLGKIPTAVLTNMIFDTLQNKYSNITPGSSNTFVKQITYSDVMEENTVITDSNGEKFTYSIKVVDNMPSNSKSLNVEELNPFNLFAQPQETIYLVNNENNEMVCFHYEFTNNFNKGDAGNLFDLVQDEYNDYKSYVPLDSTMGMFDYHIEHTYML